MSDADMPADRYERALILMNLLIDRATGNVADDASYKLLRREFMEDTATAPLLPRYVRTCRELSAFWPIAKTMHKSWEGRRVQIRDDFEPLVGFLEAGVRNPLDQGAAAVLTAFSTDGAAVIWSKALERRNTDPEGAITAARTLLEAASEHDHGHDPDDPFLGSRQRLLSAIRPVVRHATLHPKVWR